MQFGRRVGFFEGLGSLRWEQLGEMGDLVDEGAHTHSHVQASRLPFAAVRGLKLNIEAVRANLGVTPTLLSYAWGQPRDVLP